MNRFEQLIEYVINDEEAKAKELFHQIVVEKSRAIYEDLMDEEAVEEAEEQVNNALIIKEDNNTLNFVTYPYRTNGRMRF